MYYRVDTGSWNNRGICDQSANFVERVAQQQVRIDLYNYSDQFGADRTPFFEVRAYNDIHIPIDGAAVVGTDLYNELTPMLGPQVRFYLDISNPPQTIYDACTTTAGLRLEDYDGSNAAGRGWCNENPSGQFSGNTGTSVQVVNYWSDFGREYQAPLHVWGAGFQHVVLPTDQNRTPADCGCHKPSPQPNIGGPVNSRTGNYWNQETDLSVTSPGPALDWTRSYNSQAITETSGVLSSGWQHPYAARLILPSMPGGEANTVIVFSGEGNKLRFEDLGSNQGYKAYPGIYSTLTQSSGTYVQTLADQRKLTFDATSGRLLNLTDAQGRALNLIYNTSTPPQLTQIADADDSSRALNLTWANGRIATVSDGTRTIGYQYDTNGDLEQVSDVMGRVTSYDYQNHLLTDTTNALGQVTTHLEYDAYTPFGKVSQLTSQDGQQVQYTYTTTSTSVLLHGTDSQQLAVRVDYASTNVMTGMQANGTPILTSAFDRSFSPGQVQDVLGHTTRTTYTSTGLPTAITNALGQTTRATYDSHNNLTETADALGVRTQYTYNTQDQLVRVEAGITSASAVRATTLYTYMSGDLLLEQRAPDGVVTRYTYGDSQHPRQPSQATVGYGTAQAQTTAYQYDALGRAIITTVGYGTVLARTDRTTYNADNTVATAIQNYKNGVFDSAHPDEDIITTYGYDDLGRLVWMRDALGHYTVTHYDAAGRSDWTALNLTPFQLDSQGQPIFQSYSPTQSDANVATLYGYDGLGHTTLVTQTGILTGTFDTSTLRFSQATTRVTRTEYNTLGQPVREILNYRPDLSGLGHPDANQQIDFVYDPAGNLIRQRDQAGRYTYTEYDAINRPVKTIRNYENGNPLTVDPGSIPNTTADTDLISVTRYDAVGRIEQQIDNYVDGIFVDTQPITDRITLYQYDALNRVVTATLNYAPGELGYDLNRATVMAYDSQTMRVIGTRDAIGHWQSVRYDALGRVTMTTANCRDGQDTPVSQGCASFDGANSPDRNVPSQVHYDLLGRAYEQLDALGYVTHTDYDQLGRAVAVTRHYVATGPVNADTNVTTQQTYDALGRVTISTNELGATSQTEYDGLGQPIRMLDERNRETRMGYDGTGELRWVKRPDGQITVHQVDGLGRVVQTIVNYQDGLVSAGELADRDLITRRQYHSDGSLLQETDPAGRTTQFFYDQRGLLVWVQENWASFAQCGATSPCTAYKYDRAGNRTAIVDARGNIRRFSYDAANQQVTATDALGRTTNWSYDAQGRQVSQTDGRSGTWLNWWYDDLGRLTQTLESHGPPLASITTMSYDGLGRRTRIINSNQVAEFSYDALGRPTQVATGPSGTTPNVTVGYSYDAAGRRTQLTYPDSTAVNYAYWADGQLQSVTQGSTTLASYAYDSAARLQSVTRSNGATTTYTYDGADRLTDLHTVVGSSDVSRFQYTLDRAGLRSAATETLAGQARTIAYTYNGMRRLTGVAESPGATYEYSYDATGNHTQVKVNNTVTESHSYDAANQVSDTGWTYDAAGNLLSDGTTTYTYDAFNRMLNATAGGQIHSYEYNGDGILIEQAVNGTWTSYTQDLVAPLSQVLQTTQGISTTKYLYGLDRLAAVSSSTRTWYGSDALGSVRQTLNDTGVSLNTINYDPWGTPESGSVLTFGFTGELQDSATGLVHLRARWYDTEHGTLLTRDPFAGYPEQPYSLHPYQYGYSNPVSYIDPSGMCSIPYRDYTPGQPTYPGPCIKKIVPPKSVMGADLFIKVYEDSICWIPAPKPEPGQPEKHVTAYPEGLIDLGYIEGTSLYGDIAYGTANVGLDNIFDLYDFEYGHFSYESAGVRTPGLGVGITGYVGLVVGWSNFDVKVRGVENYSGPFNTASLGAQFPWLTILGAGIQGFASPDWNMFGGVIFGSVGIGADIPVSISVTRQFSTLRQKRSFHAAGEGPTYDDAKDFAAFLSRFANGSATGRTLATAVIFYNAYLWEDFRNR